MSITSVFRSVVGCGVILSGVLFSAPALASVVVLNFAGLNGQGQERVQNFYNGGFGSLGSSGTNYGIRFGTDALACNGQPGGTCNVGAIPGGPGANIVFFLSGTGSIMNVAAGFDTGFSFFYSAINNAGIVNVFGGENGTGALLTSLNLAVTPSTPGSNGCSGGAFCPFFAAGVNFAGIARSVNFSGTANQIAFANITLGSATAGGGNNVPEPGSLALAGIALLGAVAARRRQSA